MGTPFVQFLCLDERQQPVFQVQMHVRRRVPLPKIATLHTMLSKLRIAKLQLIVPQVLHFVAPIAVPAFRLSYTILQQVVIATRIIY